MGKRENKVVTAGKSVHIDYGRNEDYLERVFVVQSIKGRDYTLQHEQDEPITLSSNDHYFEVVRDEQGRDVR